MATSRPSAVFEGLLISSVLLSNLFSHCNATTSNRERVETQDCISATTEPSSFGRASCHTTSNLETTGSESSGSDGKLQVMQMMQMSSRDLVFDMSPSRLADAGKRESHSERISDVHRVRASERASSKGDMEPLSGSARPRSENLEWMRDHKPGSSHSNLEPVRHLDLDRVIVTSGRIDKDSGKRRDSYPLGESERMRDHIQSKRVVQDSERMRDLESAKVRDTVDELKVTEGMRDLQRMRDIESRRVRSLGADKTRNLESLKDSGRMKNSVRSDDYEWMIVDPERGRHSDLGVRLSDRVDFERSRGQPSMRIPQNERNFDRERIRESELSGLRSNELENTQHADQSRGQRIKDSSRITDSEVMNKTAQDRTSIMESPRGLDAMRHTQVSRDSDRMRGRTSTSERMSGLSNMSETGRRTGLERMRGSENSRNTSRVAGSERPRDSGGYSLRDLRNHRGTEVAKSRTERTSCSGAGCHVIAYPRRMDRESRSSNSDGEVTTLIRDQLRADSNHSRSLKSDSIETDTKVATSRPELLGQACRGAHCHRSKADSEKLSLRSRISRGINMSSRVPQPDIKVAEFKPAESRSKRGTRQQDALSSEESSSCLRNEAGCLSIDGKSTHGSKLKDMERMQPTNLVRMSMCAGEHCQKPCTEDTIAQGTMMRSIEKNQTTAASSADSQTKSSRINWRAEGLVRMSQLRTNHSTEKMASSPRVNSSNVSMDPKYLETTSTMTSDMQAVATSTSFIVQDTKEDLMQVPRKEETHLSRSTNEEIDLKRVGTTTKELSSCTGAKCHTTSSKHVELKGSITNSSSEVMHLTTTNPAREESLSNDADLMHPDAVAVHKLCAYTIVTQTGKQVGAGTNSNISLRLSNKAKKEVLFKGLANGQKTFQRGHEDTFFLRGPCVQHICGMDLSTDNYGLFSKWFVETLSISVSPLDEINVLLQEKRWQINKWLPEDDEPERLHISYFDC